MPLPHLPCMPMQSCSQDATGAETDLEVTLWSRPWLAAKNDVNEPAWKLTKVERVNASS